jgi:hypothetical protein
MSDDTAVSAADAATEAARLEILAAIDATGPGAVGHGAIRLRVDSDPPPAAAPEPAGDPAAAAAPERAGHGRVRLRGSR